MNRISIQRDTLSGVLLIGLGVWIWWQSASFPQLENGYPGPSLFPQTIAIGLACAGVFIALRRTKSNGRTVEKVSKSIPSRFSGLLRLSAGLGLAVLYPVLIQYTHFIPVMAMLICFVGLLLKNAAWHALFMSILSAALIYALFTQLLSVPL